MFFKFPHAVTYITQVLNAAEMAAEMYYRFSSSPFGYVSGLPIFVILLVLPVPVAYLVASGDLTGRVKHTTFSLFFFKKKGQKQERRKWLSSYRISISLILDNFDNKCDVSQSVINLKVLKFEA